MRTRGGVLFEVLLSIAIFTGAALFTLRAVRGGLESLDRQRREARALDLARTTLSLLEVGLIDLADLRDGDVDAIDEALGIAPAAFDETLDEPRWMIEAESQQTEYEGLSLVTVIVTEETGERFGGVMSGDDGALVMATLRQLMPMDARSVEAFPTDELIADILEAGGQAGEVR